MNVYIDSLLLPQISRQRGAEYAQEVDAIFMETSALNATNVEEIFVQISELFYSDDKNSVVLSFPPPV